MKKIYGMLMVLAAASGFYATPAHAGENQGFLYGTVETRSGNTYHGVLRWGTEESFWDDHFNSSKEDMPYAEYEDDDDGARRRRVRVFGVTLGYKWDMRGGNRHFVARFGDIEKLEIHGGDRVYATMKSGTVYELDGGSNDIGAKITVLDESLGDVKLEWNRIERITFGATPSSAPAPAQRLYGVLTTERGEHFEGFIQWDLQECLWTDELDGETEDGDVAIEMGRIKTIEKRSRRGAWVTLKDGRRMLLEDTNDVDDSIDGIFVEDERIGRVKVNWDEFAKLDLQDTVKTGRGYGDYAPGKRIHGKVTDRDGQSYTGDIVFDLDESESWEMLEGDQHDLEYLVPFEKVKTVEPIGYDASRVVLKSGVTLELEDSTDVSDDIAGVVILDGGRETYVPWRDLQKIEVD